MFKESKLTVLHPIYSKPRSLELIQGAILACNNWGANQGWPQIFFWGADLIYRVDLSCNRAMRIKSLWAVNARGTFWQNLG